MLRTQSGYLKMAVMVKINKDNYGEFFGTINLNVVIEPVVHKI